MLSSGGISHLFPISWAFLHLNPAWNPKCFSPSRNYVLSMKFVAWLMPWAVISLLDLLEWSRCPTVSKPTVLCTASIEFCTEACLQAVAQHLPNQQFNSSSLRQTVACLQYCIHTWRSLRQSHECTCVQPHVNPYMCIFLCYYKYSQYS